MKKALAFSQQNQERQLGELLDFIKIPSISTDQKHANDVRTAADWLSQRMLEAGLEHVAVLDTPGHPLVYGDWLGQGMAAPTILVYGHYDVQPADPIELWERPPFEPQIRDDYIYGRGSSDDKGQVYIHIKAVESYLKTEGELPVNIKFILEGEEEIGGANLPTFISQNRSKLAADIALISDTAMVNRQQPAIVYGLRGLLYTLLDIEGPTRDLHSGAYGGGIDNPLNALCHIVAKLMDEDGHILIPGFYDTVRPLSAEEREILSNFPLDKEGWLQETGAPEVWGEPEFALIERLGARPTMDVNGIIGGYTEPGRKTVLPAKAHAKISFRLVPNQDPDEIFRLYANFIQQITPTSVRVQISKAGGSAASITDYHIPAMKAAAEAFKDVYDKEPILMREGGSIPVVLDFQKFLGLETILMGFGLPDDKIHSPNERFYIPNFFRGIETSIRFFDAYRRSMVDMSFDW